MKRTPRIATPEGGGLSFEVPAILERLKEHLHVRTNAELSSILEVKPNTISTWKKRNTLDYPRILALCKTYSIDIHKLFFNRSGTNTPFDVKDKKGFNVVTRDSYFQYVSQLNQESFIQSLPKFYFPFISGKNIRAFQVMGASMFPILRDGDFVVGEYIDADTETLVNGKIYVLVSNIKGIYICRIRKDPVKPEVIHLVRDNETENTLSEVKMTVNEIIELWEVNSVFSLDLIGNAKRENRPR
ncbi:LexA family transcriptional regulator [Sinomicrobium weinanense]|uniref:Helix-turn-helix domain-containing protein n=1 Tax=Sinomicrobium weinanense TaxID=2842200 RepID=A0A926Q5W4_9FLAO|nr:helix-turn-helix domain-containing protein [Sinomicrobium weinanense]MBC9798581.1 helix-turn-helix domain-containing protein [Sinomicrobium weinanense]MBU3125592.1 helix-turn-helix domain-containing protein [Sinomicrobium weinanense]